MIVSPGAMRTPSVRLLLVRLGAALGLLLTLARPACPAPVDGIAPGACPAPEGEVASGIPTAFLCDVQNQSPLDQPIDEFEPALVKRRAGAYGALRHSAYLISARPVIGEERFLELFSLLATRMIAPSATVRAYQRCAAAEPEPLASLCRTEADTLLQGTVDSAIPELLASRADPDRSFLLDPQQPIPDVADLVSHLAPGLAQSLKQLDTGTLPGVNLEESAQFGVVPLLVGPDGRYNTADDLPETRERLHPDLQLETNIPAGFTTYIPGFAAVVYVRGTLDIRTGTPQVLFGIGDEEAMRVNGCVMLGGTLEGVVCRDAIGQVIEPARVREAGCPELAQGGNSAAGFNGQGDCVVLNNQTGVGAPGTFGVNFFVIPSLSDLRFRPATAILEPTDLTDFQSFALFGARLPTRPVVSFASPPSRPAPSRRVDPVTGAPVRATGPRICSLRTRGSEGPVGPDGLAGTFDDGIPSSGNCLLFDPPETEQAVQPLRTPHAIRTDHPGSQELFHRACSATFDDDLGGCPLELANQPWGFTALAQLLSGLATGVQTLLFQGIDTIRVAGQSPTASSFVQPGEANQASATSAVIVRAIPGSDISRTLPLSVTEGGLLGCGLHFLAACGSADDDHFGENPLFRGMLGLRPDQRPAGGLDLQYADASVLLQESPLLQAFEAGAPVGSAAGELLPGIQSGGFSLDEVLNLGESGRASLVDAGGLMDAWVEPFKWKADPKLLAEGIVVYQVADLGRRDPRCDPDAEGRPRDALGEPVFDPEEASYCTSRVPIWPADPNVVVLNDPTDASNLANVFQSGGENCTPFIQALVRDPRATVAGTFFDEGCTKLETLSSNYIRTLIAVEIVGKDRVLDPPETLEEFDALLANDPNGFLSGDPESGPDGILTRNVRVFADPGDAALPTEQRRLTGRNDVHALRFEQSQGVVVPTAELLSSLDLDGDGQRDHPAGTPVAQLTPLSALTMAEFFDAVNPETLCPAGGNRGSRCHAQVGVVREVFGRSGQLPSSTPEAIALPLGIRANFSLLDGGLVPPQFSQPMINMWELAEKRPLEFAAFWQGDAVKISNVDSSGAPLPLDDPKRIRLKFDRAQTGGPFVVDFDTIRVRAVPNILDGLKSQQQFDPDGIATSAQPLDQDRDGVYDGIDDGGLGGPVTDDNPFCGSGIRGDVLQNAVQFEPVSEAEEEALQQRFPDGLPPRSPVFCRSLAELHGYTVKRADGTRAFRWHAAEGPDADADGAPDALDNCPGVVNYDQEDTGGVGFGSAPDGIGDHCQCGDVTKNFVVTATDSLVIQYAALRLPPFEEGLDVEQQVGNTWFIPDRCDVTGNKCDATDALAISRASLGLGPPLLQSCPAVNAR